MRIYEINKFNQLRENLHKRQHGSNPRETLINKNTKGNTKDSLQKENQESFSSNLNESITNLKP